MWHVASAVGTPGSEEIKHNWLLSTVAGQLNGSSAELIEGEIRGESLFRLFCSNNGCIWFSGLGFIITATATATDIDSTANKDNPNNNSHNV